MNERDSEQVARMFVEGGYTLTREEQDADAKLFVILTDKPEDTFLVWPHTCLPARRGHLLLLS